MIGRKRKFIKEVKVAVTGEGVEVSTKGSSEKQTENLLNRIIKKHKDFMIFKRKNRVGMGYYE